MSVLSLQLPQGSRGAMWRAALLPGVGLASCLAPTLIAHHSASSHARSLLRGWSLPLGSVHGAQ